MLRTLPPPYRGKDTFLLDTLGNKLVLDINPDFGVTITGSGASRILDLSGRGNHHTQGTDANRPAVVANVINGHTVLRGVVATRKFMSCTTLKGISPGDFPRYYVICSATANNTNGGPFEIGSGSGKATSLAFADSYNTASQYQNGVTTGAPFRTLLMEFADAKPISPSLYDIGAVSGGVATVSKNGVAKTTQFSTGSGYLADPMTTTVIVSRYSTNFDGDFIRMFIANPAPTAAQHTAIISYLRETYPALGL